MHDVLVHVRDYRVREPAAAYAATLAAHLRANLTAVHVPPAMPLLPGYDVSGVLAHYADFLEDEMAKARLAGPGFLAWAASMGAQHPRWTVSAGPLAGIVRYMAHWHDVLVLGADPGDPWGTPGALAELVLGARVPCIVVPSDAPAADARCARILVAWNGSAEAIRALHAALPLLQQAERITVLKGAPKASDRPLPEFDLDDWFARHALAPEGRTPVSDADAGRAILEAAYATEAQLIVMGAYGRTRLSEWVLGGVTRDLLRHSRVPLFMRH